MMQFLPDTWRRHRRSDDHDPFNPADAVHAAADYLHHAGATEDLAHALYRYNRSWRYVDQVMTKAADYDAHGAIPRDCHGDQQLELVSDMTADPEALIDNPAVQLHARAVADLRHPHMDPRVIAIMHALADQHSYAVSVIKTGHSRCVGGGNTCPASRVSHHWHYRALDIWRIDNQPVTATNPTARSIVEWTSQLDGQLRPDEVGSPFHQWTQLRGWFTDHAHQGHIHIGYAAH